MEGYSFGHWLRLKRKSLDLTREGLAGRVGCSAGTIQKLEEEERRPSLPMAERLAQIFDIPPNEQPEFLRFARGELHSWITKTQQDAPVLFHGKAVSAISKMVWNRFCTVGMCRIVNASPASGALGSYLARTPGVPCACLRNCRDQTQYPTDHGGAHSKGVPFP